MSERSRRQVKSRNQDVLERLDKLGKGGLTNQELLDDSSSDEELVVSGKKARYDDDDLDDFVVDDGADYGEDPLEALEQQQSANQKLKKTTKQAVAPMGRVSGQYLHGGRTNASLAKDEAPLDEEDDAFLSAVLGLDDEKDSSSGASESSLSKSTTSRPPAKSGKIRNVALFGHRTDVVTAAEDKELEVRLARAHEEKERQEKESKLAALRAANLALSGSRSSTTSISYMTDADNNDTDMFSGSHDQDEVNSTSLTMSSSSSSSQVRHKLESKDEGSYVKAESAVQTASLPSSHSLASPSVSLKASGGTGSTTFNSPNPLAPSRLPSSSLDASSNESGGLTQVAPPTKAQAYLKEYPLYQTGPTNESDLPQQQQLKATKVEEGSSPQELLMYWYDVYEQEAFGDQQASPYIYLVGKLLDPASIQSALDSAAKISTNANSQGTSGMSNDTTMADSPAQLISDIKVNPNQLRTVSCCIVIKNVKRSMYFLPRKYELSNASDPTSVTDTPVSFLSCFNEVKSLLNSRGIQRMEAKQVNMKYCFGRQDVFDPKLSGGNGRRGAEDRDEAEEKMRDGKNIKSKGKKGKKGKSGENDQGHPHEEDGDDESEDDGLAPVTSEDELPLWRKSLLDPVNIVPAQATYLHVRYPSCYDALPRDLVGKTFSHVFGARTSRTELFLMTQKLSGPGWVVVSNPRLREASEKHSWCHLEWEIDMADSPASCIRPYMSTQQGEALDLPAPRLKVTSLAFKTMLSGAVATPTSHVSASAAANQQHEIMVATVCTHSNVSVDGKTANENDVQETTLIRLPQGQAWLDPYTHEMRRLESKDGSVKVRECENERALISQLLVLLQHVDPDAIVSHDLHGWGIEMFLTACKRNPALLWSKVGRLKRTRMPSSQSSLSLVDFGAGAGRLMIDTQVAAMEFLAGSKQYTLSYLADTQLGIQHTELEPHRMDPFFVSGSAVADLVRRNSYDARLQLKLMFHLDVIPLTKQLTELCGNRWQRTLRSARAERVEYLLLQEFSSQNYIVPEKLSMKERLMREAIEKKLLADEEGEDDGKGSASPATVTASSKGRRKKAQYSGGKVLDPKRGYYDQWILLLDFNSLYPSIIREYNLCFSTTDHWVRRTEEDLASLIPPAPAQGESNEAILPGVVKRLIHRRKTFKDKLEALKKVDAAGTEEERALLNIKQLAFKLVANSMYGCLGFSSSRFYCQPIAALITTLGRTELLRSKAVAEALHAEVIYGDTDSLMVNTRTDDFLSAKQLAQQIIAAINKEKRVLRIGEDGLFKSLLLFNKKRYAALKLDGVIELHSTQSMPDIPKRPGQVISRVPHPSKPDTTFLFRFKKEVKGLDQVRRDWAPISRMASDHVLNILLANKSRDETRSQIIHYLNELSARIDANKEPFSSYIMTKKLTRDPRDYANPKDLPHVCVALDMLRRKEVVRVNAVIEYVIVAGQGSVAQRAKSAGEVLKQLSSPTSSSSSNEPMTIDFLYYKELQVLPPILRLCDIIDNITPGEIADALGLESSKYNARAASAAQSRDNLDEQADVTDYERFKHCRRLTITCPTCRVQYHYPGVYNYVRAITERDPPHLHDPLGPLTQVLRTPDMAAKLNKAGNLSGFICPTRDCVGFMYKGDGLKAVATSLRNQMTLEFRASVAKYYEYWQTFVHKGKEAKSRDFMVEGTGPISKDITDEELYNQLLYFSRCFDIDRADYLLKEEMTWREHNPELPSKRKEREEGKFTPRSIDVKAQVLAGSVVSVLNELKHHADQILLRSNYHMVDFKDLFKDFFSVTK